MRNIISLRSSVLAVLLFASFISCQKDKENSKLFNVVTVEVYAIRNTDAVCVCSVEGRNSDKVAERGVCWSNTTSPTIEDSRTVEGGGTGSFTSYLTGLTSNTTYYARAYARNRNGVTYGNPLKFTTNRGAELTTSEVSMITQTSAMCGGNITFEGIPIITTRGICWSVNANPTINDNMSINGSGLGSFVATMTDLSPNTTYYVRAYATSSTETVYGNLVSFQTFANTINFNPGLTYGTMTDIDGNVYKTITIGSQTWMAENLRTTHYRNGDAVENVTDNVPWYELTTGAYCQYENNASISVTYGLLYNWYAVSDARNLAPVGWRVPTHADWDILIKYLDPTANINATGSIGTDIGGSLKEATLAHWQSPNAGATNSSGFTALPGGFRENSNNNGNFFDNGGSADFWTSTMANPNEADFIWISYYGQDIYIGSNWMAHGFSVRCVKN
jgi:uncharacterized protein (TIGR02145 family)